MISYYNREKKTYEKENVVGEGPINWLYGSSLGKGVLETVVKKKFFSFIYGKYLDTKLSRNMIPSFIKKYSINQDEFIKKIHDYKSFNDFFSRKLIKGGRKIETNNDILISPGDGKILAYEQIGKDSLIQIKGFTYSLKELIHDETLSDKYNHGSMVVLRLCPTDYHRFHFIDKGSCEKTTKIKGYYYSVNPAALSVIKKIFCQNKRQFSLFHSENFKDVLYVEVGASCVGSLVNTYTPDLAAAKGDEKGYFKFGGSTIILFFEKNTIKIDDDILTHSDLGIETMVKLGEKIGIKKKGTI